MARLIIPFTPNHHGPEAQALRIDTLVHAAWHFAICALWPERKFSKQDQEAAQDYVREYFTAATDDKRAFKALIQRVVLTRNYVQCREDRFLPDPSVWFNRRYPFGFAGTLAWLQRIERQRQEVPGYLGHLEAIANGYYRYSLQPTSQRFDKCREQLVHHRADNLLHLFYSTVAHAHNRA